jgi:hypothetical protein
MEFVALSLHAATIAGPEYDIDFSIAEMLPEYLGITTASAVARRVGKTVSPRKAAGAKANGAQGGRPKRKISYRPTKLPSIAKERYLNAAARRG